MSNCPTKTVSCSLLTYRYHVLIYGAEEQNPEWLQPSSPEYGDWTPEEKRQIIIDHVSEVVTMYKVRNIPIALGVQSLSYLIL